MPSFRQAFSPFFLKKLFDPRHVLDCTAQLDYGFADTNCAIRSTGRHGRRGGPAAAGGRATRERRNGPAVSMIFPNLRKMRSLIILKMAEKL